MWEAYAFGVAFHRATWKYCLVSSVVPSLMMMYPFIMGSFGFSFLAAYSFRVPTVLPYFSLSLAGKFIAPLSIGLDFSIFVSPLFTLCERKALTFESLKLFGLVPLGLYLGFRILRMGRLRCHPFFRLDSRCSICSSPPVAIGGWCVAVFGTVLWLSIRLL